MGLMMTAVVGHLNQRLEPESIRCSRYARATSKECCTKLCEQIIVHLQRASGRRKSKNWLHRVVRVVGEWD